MTQSSPSITDNLPISNDQKEQIAEKANEVKSQVTGQITSQVGSQASKVGEQASTVADALRTSGQQLQDKGQSAPANLVNMAADRAQQLSDYLSYTDPNQILSDVEDFCRQQPWMVAAGAVALGFMGARFLKSSSSNRYSASSSYVPRRGGRQANRHMNAGYPASQTSAEYEVSPLMRHSPPSSYEGDGAGGMPPGQRSTTGSTGSGRRGL